MRNRFVTLFAVLAAAAIFAPAAFSQTYGTKGASPGAWKPDELPPDLAKPKPYDPHDLSGVWASPTEALDTHWLGEHGGQGGINGPDIFVIRPPLTEWGEELLESRHPGPNGDNDAKGMGGRARFSGYDNDPLSMCDPLGYPHAWWAALDRPFEFMQTPGRMLMHVEYHELWRSIWMDGRELPKNPDPAWNGYSVGRWEGDTFVIVSTGYDERTWFDRMGDPCSSEGVLEERWHRPDYDTLEVTLKLTDPKAYTKPWVGDKQVFKRQKFALFEEMCVPSEEESFQTNQRDVAAGKK